MKYDSIDLSAWARRFVGVILCTAALTAAGIAGTPSAHWQRAYVVDSAIATLRASPGLQSKLLKRLRHGRMVAIVGPVRSTDGLKWVRVAVTRRTRGWLPASSIASPGDANGERLLSSRIESSSGFARLELARLAIDRFPRLRGAAAVAFAEEAERAAKQLTLRASRRFAGLEELDKGQLRLRMLLDPLLDRYVRLGVRFEADPTTLTYRAH